VTKGVGRVVTTDHVIGETWTLLRRRSGHRAAVGFLDRLYRLPDTEEDAWRWLRSHDEREYSFVDATSFSVMRRRRIREALAFDGDFNAAGFVEVRPA
jgi:predicted nucleic acid-binding protein